jgi:hypothetical protein
MAEALFPFTAFPFAVHLDFKFMIFLIIQGFILDKQM